MSINWISEADELPRIGQTVLLASPRSTGEFWDILSVALLVRHEAVVPRPIAAGSEWPTDYYWGSPKSNGERRLITGNAFWSKIRDLPLPPGAQHQSSNGYDFVAQVGNAFVPQKEAPLQR